MTMASEAGIWRGQGAYQAHTTWGPVSAVAAVIAMFAAAIALGGLLAVTVGPMVGVRSPLAGGATTSDDAIAFSLIWQLGLQIGLVVAALFAAKLFGGRLSDTLALKPVAGGFLANVTAILSAFGVLVMVVAAYSAVTYLIWPEKMLSDLRPFVDIARSDLVYLLAFLTVVGAPLSEELVFRGFLQSALSSTRLGFAGAALVGTAAWSLLHFNYSMIGLGAVFVVGLTFCWILWRTGSVWVTIACHALYNAVVLGLVISLAQASAV